MVISAILVGLAICYGTWPILSWWLDGITQKSELPSPYEDVSKQVWEELIRSRKVVADDKPTITQFWLANIGKYPESAPVWLGILERTLSFGAVLANAPIAIAGWLAFKVASKWQVWANLVQVPKAPSDGPGKDEIKALTARHRWGSYVLMRFLLGTLGNVIVGALVAFGIKHVAL